MMAKRNRVELDWGPDGNGDAVGPDGTIYRIFSEHPRGEPRVHNVMMSSPQGGCGFNWVQLPNGDESHDPRTQRTRARRHAESLLEADDD